MTVVKAPLKAPHGVRTAERMYASCICCACFDETLNCRWTAASRCCGCEATERLQAAQTGRRMADTDMMHRMEGRMLC